MGSARVIFYLKKVQHDQFETKEGVREIAQSVYQKSTVCTHEGGMEVFVKRKSSLVEAKVTDVLKGLSSFGST